MNNTTCANISTSVLSGHLNTTFQQNCTNSLINGSAQNSASAKRIYEMYPSTAKIVAYSIVYGVISIIALTGHIMVFLVMALNRTMHTATNVLLLNLSLSDILFVVFAVPGLLAQEVCNGRWPFDETMGKISQQTTILVAASSVFTMMAIAFERYLAVVFPLKQMARRKKTTIAVAVVAIWVCAIAFSIPLGIYVSVVPYPVNIRRNGTIVVEKVNFLAHNFTENQSKAYNVAIFITINVIPIIFLSFFYASVVWKLWNRDKRLTADVAMHSKHQQQLKNFVEKTRRKTTIMLLTVVLVFFICLFPLNMMNMLSTFDALEGVDTDVILHINSVLRIMLVVNSASNPIIYNFLSEKFRAGFASIFTCRWRALRRVAATTDAETVLT